MVGIRYHDRNEEDGDGKNGRHMMQLRKDVRFDDMRAKISRSTSNGDFDHDENRKGWCK